MECCGILADQPDDIAAGDGNHCRYGRAGFLPARREMPRFFTQAGTTAKPIETVGIVTEACKSLLTEEERMFQERHRQTQAGGVDMREVCLPDFALFPLVHQIVGSVEASSSCGKYDGVRYGHRAAGAKNWNEMYLKSARRILRPL